MERVVSDMNILTFGVMAGIGFLAPLALALIWKLKTKQPFLPIIVGAIIFPVFALGLETLPKLVLFQVNNPIGKYVMSQPVLFGLLAALMAGLFEETGRFVAFKYILKKYDNKETAISYGIGHGGIEVLIIMGIASIQYLSYALMIRNGQFDQIIQQVAQTAPEQLEAIQAIPAVIASAGVANVVLATVERISAVIFHIACSIIVFSAVKEKGKLWRYPLAIVLHMGLDIFAAMYQVGYIRNLILLEVIVMIIAIATFAYSYRFIYKKIENVTQE